MNLTAVVVTYKTPDLIRNAVASIKKFYPNLKIIIIDNEKNNIGHAEGLKKGIAMCDTKYVLLFDSDIIMKGKCIELMLAMFDRNTYGVGQIVQVDEQGHNIQKGISYLHPHFCIINRELYLKGRPLKHCGAPFIEAMKKMPDIKHFDVPYFINHIGRQTRAKVQQEQTGSVENSLKRYDLSKLPSSWQNRKPSV